MILDSVNKSIELLQKTSAEIEKIRMPKRSRAIIHKLLSIVIKIVKKNPAFTMSIIMSIYVETGIFTEFCNMRLIESTEKMELPADHNQIINAELDCLETLKKRTFLEL